MSSSNNLSSTNRETFRIFSQPEWNKLYPKKNTSYPHHFLIARNDSKAIESIRSPQLAHLLIARDPQHHQLTPLMIASMKGDERVVEELLKQDLVKKSINATDEYGWTALHHATLTSDAIFQKLIAAGAKPNPLTNLRGTPDDLRALTAPGSRSESIQNVSFQGKPFTEEQAKETFKMSAYRDVNYFAPEFLKDLWKQEADTDSPSARYIKETLKPRPPKVDISLLNAGFYGLTAGEQIAPGMIVGEYAGEWVTNECDYRSFPETFPRTNKEKYAYLFGDFDAKQMGNATRFINNGFPNALPFGLVDGGVNKSIFIAPETIEEGEPILFNYGAKAYAVTYGPQILFNRDKIHAFFKPGLEAISQEVKALSDELKGKLGKERVSLSRYLKQSLLESRLGFAIDNPLCLIDLHFSKVIDAKEWLKGLTEGKADWAQSWEANHGSLVTIHLREMLIRLLKIDQSIKQHAPNEHPIFEKWVLDHCQTLTLLELMKGMDWIQEAFVVKKDPSLVDGIEARLKSHDWSRDEEHLYSYTSRKAAFERHIDFALLPDKDITDANFFPTKKNQVTKSLDAYGAHTHFTGSELEKMLFAIRDSAPKTAIAQAEYLAKAKAEFQEIQTLIE